MHTDIGMLHMYRRSDSLSTGPDDMNTLTCQSTDKKDAPRDPIHGLITHVGVCLMVLKLYSDYLEWNVNRKYKGSFRMG